MLSLCVYKTNTYANSQFANNVPLSKCLCDGFWPTLIMLIEIYEKLRESKKRHEPVNSISLVDLIVVEKPSVLSSVVKKR